MTRILATLSLILTILFILAILALHILKPDVNPMVSGISFYALGKIGLMLGVAIAMIGISGIALAVALWPRVHSTAGHVGLVLLVAWGLTSILAGLFPLDAPGAAPTLSGTIHNLSGMNFLLLVPALLLIELSPSKGSVTLRPLKTTYWLAWLILAAAILLFVFNGPLYSLQVGGVMQRFYWLVFVLWLIFKAARTRDDAAPMA